MPKNVLILCPHLKERGGVANYYSLVKKYFRSDSVNLSFYHTGNIATNKGFAKRVHRSVTDLLRLFGHFPESDLVVLNPSFDLKAIIRDGIYHFTAKSIFHKKTIVFFRGWNAGFTNVVDNYCRRLFRFFFNPDKILVLSKGYKDLLIKWGFHPDRIVIETTTYEGTDGKAQKDIANIIFLSRFAHEKGCLEAIKTIEMLAGEFPQIKLYMVGEGPLMPELKQYVALRKLGRNVKFTGWLEHQGKYRLLHQCGIMLFPTNYGEGMPNSILEGMGAGLAIITRPVAGIPEIVAEGKNGFLVKSLDPNDFALKVRYLFGNKEVWEFISATNRRVAEERYEIKNVVKRLNNYFCEMLG